MPGPPMPCPGRHQGGTIAFIAVRAAIRYKNGLVIPPKSTETVPGVSTVARTIIGSRSGHAYTGRFIRRWPQRHGWRGRLSRTGNAVIGGVSGTGCQQGQQAKGYDRAHGRRLHQCLPVCLCAGSLLGGVVRAWQTVSLAVPMASADGGVDMGIDGGDGLGFVLSPGRLGFRCMGFCLFFRDFRG